MMKYRSARRSIRAVWAPSLIRRVARHRATRVAVLVVAVGLATLVVQAKIAALESERARWAKTSEVFVVHSAVAPGDAVGPAVTRSSVPIAMIPPGAVSSLDHDARARSALYVGEVLVGERVTDRVGRGLPEGTAAITLALAGRTPLVGVGDLVDVWTVDSANMSGLRIARRALVLERSDDDISIAIPAERVSEVTAAALRPVVVTLLG